MRSSREALNVNMPTFGDGNVGAEQPRKLNKHTIRSTKDLFAIERLSLLNIVWLQVEPFCGLLGIDQNYSNDWPRAIKLSS